jgi:hypothetical protein
MVKIDLALKLNLSITFNRSKSEKPSVKPLAKKSPTEEPEDKLVTILRRWVESL